MKSRLALYLPWVLVAVVFVWGSYQVRATTEAEQRLLARPFYIPNMLRGLDLGTVVVDGRYIGVNNNQIKNLVISPKATDILLNANLIEHWKNPPVCLSIPPGVTIDFGGNTVMAAN